MIFRSVCLITQDVANLRDFYSAVPGVNPEGDDPFTLLPTEGAPVLAGNSGGVVS